MGNAGKTKGGIHDTGILMSSTPIDAFIGATIGAFIYWVRAGSGQTTLDHRVYTNLPSLIPTLSSS